MVVRVLLPPTVKQATLRRTVNLMIENDPGKLRNIRLSACLALASTSILLLLPGGIIDDLLLYASQLWPWSSASFAADDFPIDKIIHTLLFVICGALLVRGWCSPRRSYWWLFLLLLGYGMLTELLQGVVPGRGPSLDDFVADSIGAAIGVAWGLHIMRSVKITN